MRRVFANFLSRTYTQITMDTGLIILLIIVAIIAYAYHTEQSAASSLPSLSSIPIVGGLFSKLGDL